jgi:uncharacterized protein (DUF362 family)
MTVERAQLLYPVKGETVVVSKVAIMRFADKDSLSIDRTLGMIGGITDLNTAKRPVVIKVGVFTTKREHHSSVDVVRAIVNVFNKAPEILLAESDNYQGTGSDRLKVWKELFTGNVSPFNLSEDTETRQFRIGDENLQLSHILFKPNVLVSTHVLRTFDRGSILKNLFGLVPDRKKSRFHKKLPAVLADLYEAIGGIDLAVMDGTNLWHAWTGPTTRMNIILVGRDAVAVETVGATLAGLSPEKMPVIQEFAKRGLGETEIEDIEVLGVNFDELKKECETAIKASKKTKKAQGPQTWGGHANRALALLVEEGYFKPPKKRTIEDILKALEKKGLSTKGKEEKIPGFLARRVKNGTLAKERDENRKFFWAEPEN